MANARPPRVHSERPPMQVRFFQEPDIADLEAAVNAWLAADPRREIVEVRQSVVPTAAGGREILIGIWHIED